MVFKSSAVWTMSTEALIEHLNKLDAPDQIYWDARELKKTYQKFQNLDWSHFPKATKIDSQWTFVK
ncbi:MAG: hypothetical protein WBP13_00720 [Methylophilaceae bacterium]